MESDIQLFDKCINILTKELPVLRKMAGLTQKQLAEILDVSRQTITNIESGACKMKRSHFLAIMLIFALYQNTSDYLKNLDIPYSDLKQWLHSRKGV